MTSLSIKLPIKRRQINKKVDFLNKLNNVGLKNNDVDIIETFDDNYDDDDDDDDTVFHDPKDL